MRTYQPLLSIGLAVSLIASACQSATAPAGATSSAAPIPVELRIGAPSELPSLDPMVDSSGWGKAVRDLVFDTLLEHDRKGALVSSLAKTWRFVPPSSWEFTLREGAKFTNGDAVTAADVKFSYDRVMDAANKSPMKSYAGPLKTVEVVGASIVRFTTSSPDAVFPERTQSIAIVPQKVVESYGLARFGKEPVGSGAYRVVEWAKDDHLTLEANREYFEGTPKIAKVTFRPIPEEATRIAALLSDQVDLVGSVSPQYMGQVQDRKDLKLLQSPGSTTNQIVMNTAVKPLDDVRVRQAISYAIDYQSLIDNIYGGQAIRQGLPISSRLFGYDPTLESKWYTYNPQKAKQLLSDAGYPDGFSLAFTSAVGATPNDKELALAIVGMLAKVNITLKYQGLEFGAWLDGYYARTWPMTMLATHESMLDADKAFGNHFLSTGRGNYKNAEMDNLIKASRAEMDSTKRLSLVRNILAKALDEAIQVWLVIADETWAMKKNLEFEPITDVTIALPVRTAAWR